jgi:hypothetical protein
MTRRAAASRKLLRSIATKHQVANWFYDPAVTARREAADFLRRDHQAGNASPNIGWPLADFSRVTLVLNDVPVLRQQSVLDAAGYVNPAIQK